MAAKKKATKKSTVKATSAQGSKSGFVRALPATLSAKEVVAQAKAKGIVLSDAYVYKIRSATKRPTKATGVAVAVGNGAVTAADFVRKLPEGTSAKDAVAKAKAAGLKLTTGYFYTLKSSLGLAGRKGSGAAKVVSERKPKLPASGLPNGLTLSSKSPREQAVIDALQALGIARVRSVLDAVERLQP